MLRKNISDNTNVFIKLLSMLSARDRTILVDRFCKYKSMEQVAEKLGLTKPRIQQLEDKLVRVIDQSFEHLKL